MDKFAAFAQLFANYPKPQAEMSLKDKEEKKDGPDGARQSATSIQFISLTLNRHFLPSPTWPAAIWYRSGTSASPSLRGRPPPERQRLEASSTPPPTTRGAGHFQEPRAQREPKAPPQL